MEFIQPLNLKRQVMNKLLFASLCHLTLFIILVLLTINYHFADKSSHVLYYIHSIYFATLSLIGAVIFFHFYRKDVKIEQSE
jgi:hypothetical protein